MQAKSVEFREGGSEIYIPIAKAAGTPVTERPSAVP
jgi:hypothetical protein